MSYELEVAFGPANELLNSLHTYLCKKFYKKTDLGSIWAGQTERKLSKPFASTLAETEISAEWKLMYLFLYLYPHKESAERFLAWLERMTAGEMYELLAPYMSSFPGELGAIRDRWLHLLSEWNRQYFAGTDPKLLEWLSEDAARKRAGIGTLPPDVLAEQITNGLYFEPGAECDKLVLSPQYHFQPANIIYTFGSLTVCQYAVDGSYDDPADEPSRRLYRQLRSLSEKSRLRILRYLNGGPRSFTEIVRYIGISKGITHDHIFNLRSAGLLRAHMSGDSAVAYSLRKEAIGGLQESLLGYLLAD
ncbi:ArsR/SmtB family transcription factor [Paenibacillus tyrfis]|uniref:ArsR/SmtB family transcription factor n=1 Tax=Paenibacillus tyrfis TaxID=1501230 RepID=UPI000B589D2C|nr:winged helix-turn-helix domain-containing protein [Paenibacillus tyrfis]